MRAFDWMIPIYFFWYIDVRVVAQIWLDFLLVVDVGCLLAVDSLQSFDHAWQEL